MSVTLMVRFIAVFVGTVCLAGCASAPVQEMSDARQAIAAARSAGPASVDSPEFSAAQAAIGRAQQHLEAQEYARARFAALEAKRHAGAAAAAAQHPEGGTVAAPVPPVPSVPPAVPVPPQPH